MALNRFLYAPQGTNIPGSATISQRWVVGATGAVTALGASSDPGRGLSLSRTNTGAYTLTFAPNTDGTTPFVTAIVNPVITTVDSTTPTAVQVLTTTTNTVTFQVYNTTTGAADELTSGAYICATLHCQLSGVLT